MKATMKERMEEMDQRIDVLSSDVATIFESLALVASAIKELESAMLDTLEAVKKLDERTQNSVPIPKKFTGMGDN